MNCEACAAAHREESHLFLRDCKGCAARMLSRGVDFFASRKAGVLTDRYKAALVATGLTHEEVKRERAHDYMTRDEMPPAKCGACGSALFFGSMRCPSCKEGIA